MKRVIIIFFSLAIMLVASIGKVAVSKGDVFIIRGAEKLSAKSGFELIESDIVQTAENARAQIVFNDDTVVSIGKASEFQVEEFLYEEGAGAEKQKASFKALKGAFKTITGHIGKIAPKKFNIQSRTATIGIRGTHLLGKISVESDKIACTHGAIGVTSLAGGGEILVMAGQITTVTMGQMPEPPRAYTAAEIQEMNEASGSSGDKAEEPAAVAKDEGEKKEKTAEEEVIAEDDTVTDSSMAKSEGATEGVAKVAEVIENVSQEQSAAVNKNIVQAVEKKTGVDPGTPEPEPVSGSGMNAEGYYELGTIKSTGPIDMYGKNLSSGISSASCDGIWCENTENTTSTGYRSKEMRLQRDKDQIAVNEGLGLGVISETEVQPTLLLGQELAFSATTEISEEAQGVVAQADSYDTITGKQMMATPLDGYAGFNAQYKSVSETSGSSESKYIRDEWWSYDNLGEFFVIADTTNYASTAEYIRNSGMYFGKKSSFGSLPVESFLIYQLIMETGYHYDSTENRVVSYLNQDFEGDDIYKSRVISNTANGNMLFVYPPQATEQSMGWGFVVGKSDGSSGNVALNGNNFWMNPEKDDSGNYYINFATHTADGELYGSEFQGVGMQLSNGDPDATDTSNYVDATSGPDSFETMLVAGYRTDSADMINLPSAPQTTGGSLVGWTASRFLYDSDGDGSREWTHLPAQITIVPDRATGDMAGTIVMGDMTDGLISSPAATMTIGGSGGSTSAYISDDYFASTITAYGAMTLLNDYGGYLATMPLFPVDDVSWGYFTAEFKDSADKELLFYHKSTWVAGVLTYSLKIAELTSGSQIYNFEGKVLGNIYSETKGDFVDSIRTDSSRVYIRLDFGASNIADGSIMFTTRDYPDVIWNAKIDSTGSSINSSGFYTANLSEKEGGAVSIKNPNPALPAGVLYGNVYGADGGSVGGKFHLYGSFDSIYDSSYGYWYPQTVMAAGVIKASTDTDLSDAVVYDSVLRGVDFSSWLSNPTVSGASSSSLGGSDAGHVNNNNFFIGLSGNTLTYQSFGTAEYLYSWSGTAFVEDADGIVEPDTGTLTLGSGTLTPKTMMTTPTGSYSSLNIESSADADGMNRYVVYDNMKEFFMIMEDKAGNSVDNSHYGILFAGTESDYSALESEADYVTYKMAGALGLDIAADSIETGVDATLVSGGTKETSFSMTLNTKNNNYLMISKPGETSSGQYGFKVHFGKVNEDEYTGGAYLYGNFFEFGTDNAADIGYSYGQLFGSENQGIGMTIFGYQKDTHIIAAGAKTDDAALVTLPSAALSTTSTYSGTVAAIQDISTAQFGTIENMVIDRASTTAAISGGVIKVGEISAGAVLSPIATLTINSAGYESYSSYVSDDYMAAVLDSATYIGNSFSGSGFSGNDGGILMTSNEQAGDDYASWGYWAASFGDPATTGFEISPVSTWVAGELTQNPSFIEGLQANYSGKVLGFVADINQNFEMIDTASSAVNIDIDFGAADPVTGNMSFSSDSTSWSMDIGSGAISSSTACFNAQLTNAAAGGTVIVTDGEMFGNFYGPNAETIGASFGAGGLETLSGNLVAATGAIKASRQ